MSVIYRGGKILFSNVPDIYDGLMMKMVGTSEHQFFTRHGFIYPLTGLGPDLPSILEGRALFSTQYRTTTTASFLVIDRHEAMWQADVYINDDKEYTIDVHSLPRGLGVSWSLDSNEYRRDLCAAILMADLDDEATIKQLDEQGIGKGSGFGILTLECIAVKLSIMFPEAPRVTATS
jgi:hypothetical protein